MTVVVLGASPNPYRYSYKATSWLKKYGYNVIPVGIRDGQIDGLTIQHEPPQNTEIHTITIYLNPQRQKQYYQWILDTKPQRVIFNPGSENPELQQLLDQNNIRYLEACTLTMLSIGVFDQA